MIDFLSEYRDAPSIHKLARAIKQETTSAWTIMEVCGGQTHSIVRNGLTALLPSQINLVHGPGCPVCVTPLEMIDKAHSIAQTPGVIFCSFGDMLRVPGSTLDLLTVKARGADIRVVYSPLDAVRLAAQNPNKQVVFFAVGFETTAPTTASAVLAAEKMGLNNFSLLVSHVRVPQAIELLLSAPDNSIQSFLLAGHVCTVMGYEEYEPLAERFRTPLVVCGFEPLDILEGIWLCVKQLERGEAKVENQYSRLVTRSGNRKAQEVIFKVFEPINQKWRGIGEIPLSGFGLRAEYSRFDANQIFGTTQITTAESKDCLSGLVLKGRIKPSECPAFGKSCTPDHPLGAPMVSAEGACAAYAQFFQREGS